MLESLIFALDISLTEIDHRWGPPDDIPALYEFNLESAGLTVWKDNFGLRIAHGKGGRSGTEGHYRNLEIQMKHMDEMNFTGPTRRMPYRLLGFLDSLAVKIRDHKNDSIPLT